MRAENYKEAIKICSKILDQQPDHEDALLIISMAALNLGAAYTAEAHLR